MVVEICLIGVLWSGCVVAVKFFGGADGIEASEAMTLTWGPFL